MSIEKQIIELFHFNDDDTLLAPFLENDEFYNNFPDYVQKDWCSLSQCKNFFNYQKNVEWIFGKPNLFSLDKILNKSFDISYNILFILPISRIFSTFKRVNSILEYGGIKQIYITSGEECVVWLQKGYKGDTKIQTL